MKDGKADCCPEFSPKKWDEKKVTWKSKLFIKDKVFSFFHIPLNLGSVISKNMKKLKDANAVSKETMILTDEKSLFYSNIYISAKKAIPGVHDVKVSGTFLTKVFEGPSKNMKKWTKEMEKYVKSKEQELKHMYFHYATCPNCKKKDEKNYVVLFAEI